MARIVKSEAGASLIEISITILIIAVTALMILAFSRNTFNMNKDARGNDAAFLAAEQKIVELSSLAIPPMNDSDIVWVDSIRCTRKWVCKDTGYIRRAIVRVRWTSPKGNREILLTGAVN